MKSYVRSLLDLIFPACCPACGVPFAEGERHLCMNCELSLPFFDPRENILDRFAGRIRLQDARALLKFYHEGITQTLLHAIKYRNEKALGEHLGELMAKHFITDRAFSGIDVIVPVPLHPGKERQRGYNQSLLLATGMDKLLAVGVDTNTVSRIKKSATQTRKSRAERWQNVAGIFTLNSNALTDKHVLLVDDVLTTGATLEACGETILAGGAASLAVATLAAAM